ncbi:MAG: hypothetical protein JRJ85_03885 [Deltaproteobacteria bacterium]|nr:hypothetical protein [Deltaproteobacteria bacterium]
MTLRVAAKALLYEKYAESGLVGQVFRQDADKGISYISDITVPIVDYANDYKREARELAKAEAGNYLLQLSLPNGDIRTERFEIKPDEPTDLVIVLPHEGPHEWTSLHALSGQFRQEALRTSGFTTKLRYNPAAFTESDKGSEEEYTLRILAPDENNGGEIFKGIETLSNLGKLISENLDVESARQRFGGGSDVTHPTLEDEDFAIFRFAHSGLLAQGEKDDTDYHFGPGTDLSRHYLMQRSAQGGTLVCLPTPWTNPEAQAEVELLVRKNTVPGTLDYSMTIADPMINTVLGYINTGAVYKAVGLVDQEYAQRMLFEKISCPFAAAVGGYLLVLGLDRKGYRSASDQWKHWVENLDHWFDWLPDGAILHAALHFMLGETNRDDAYDALMRAYERGLPFFTFGLKLMTDGMRYFSNEGDDRARECLRTLETVSNQTDPSQPFLSVTFARTFQVQDPLKQGVMSYA